MNSRNSRIGGLLLALSCLAGAALAAPVTVPLGGNAYITKSAPNPDEFVDDTGLHNWDAGTTTISTYFEVKQAGNLQLSLVGGLFGSTQSQVKVSVGHHAQLVTLSPAGVPNSVFPVGTFWVDKPGYVKVDLQGVSNNGGYFGDISGLQVDGTATSDGLVFANDPNNFYWSRRGPSVHLSYNVPAGTEYFYNEIHVPKGKDPIGSYFMSNGFSVGYFGMQVNSATERRVLFSVWNPSSGTTSAVGSGQGVTVQSFSGEGNGGQSYLVFPWEAGKTYRFITRAHPDGLGNTLFSAWFGTPPNERAHGADAGVTWHYIATWKYPGSTQYHTDVYSFLENFNPDTGYIGRRARYGNQWAISASGVWTPITSAYFDTDPTGLNKQRLDFAGGVEGDDFYLRNDGFFTSPVASGQTFTRPGSRVPPNVNLSALPAH